MPWDIALFFILNGFADQSPAINALIVFAATYLPYIIAAIFLLYLLLTRSLSLIEKYVAAGGAIAAALIARYAVGSPIRHFFPRPRPFLTYDIEQLVAEHSYSFPSGHALFLFAFATVVFMYNKKLGTLSYILTALVCAARIAAGIHYPSDILAGACIGIACGVATYAGSAYAVRKKQTWRKS